MPAPRVDPDTATASALARIARGLVAQRGGELSWGTFTEGLREAATRDPIESVLVTVLGATWLFYLAEREVNPKVKSVWDALVFITTCLSVGYSDIFARTTAGKAIASFVMTVGPSLAATMFDPPRSAPSPAAPAASDALEVQRAILARLEAILEALRHAAPATTPSP